MDRRRQMRRCVFEEGQDIRQRQLLSGCLKAVGNVGVFGRGSAGWVEEVERVVLHRDNRLGSARSVVGEDTAAKLGLVMERLLALAGEEAGNTVARAVPTVGD